MAESDEGRQTGPAAPEGGERAPVAGAILFFGFGILAGFLIAFSGLGFLEDSAGLIAAVFLIAVAVVAMLGLLVVVFRERILRRLFGVAHAQVEQFARPLAQVAERAAERDPGGATQAARELVQIALARYAWILTRRWIVTSLTALIAAMAALAGTALLFKQNQLIAVQSGLLEEQNRRIEEQTLLLSQEVQLAEAARNAALAVEITGIAAALGEVAAAVQGDAPQATINVLDPEDLGRALILRITSVSRAARPYRFLDHGLLPDDPNDRTGVAMQRRDDLPETRARMAAAFGWAAPETENRLIDRPLSPERGQLLTVLAAGGVRNLEALNLAGFDLAFADLQNAEMGLLTAQAGRLAYADFSGAWLTECDFGGAVLDNARFRRARLTATTFASVGPDRARAPLRAEDAPFRSFLSGADFAGAVLWDVEFTGAAMLAAGFDGALLVRPGFREAGLGAATFRSAVLLAPDFAGAELRSADLDGAIVFGADFLAALEAAAAPGSFVVSRYEMQPLAGEEVMAVNILYQTLTAEEVAAITGDAPAFRLKRVQGFEE